MKYTILGKSNSTISIILENLYSQYNENFSINIIKNMEDTSILPYAIDNIKINEFDHDNFDYDINLTNYILGGTQVETKKCIFYFFNKKYNINETNYCNIIPKHVVISKTVIFKNGFVINCGCVIAPYVNIGKFVTINRNSSIGHHTVIGDFVTINPGTNIAGNCYIGDDTTIGIGVTIIDGITIGKKCFIGAGSVVTKNISDNVIAYGVPCKIIRENNHENINIVD